MAVSLLRPGGAAQLIALVGLSRLFAYKEEATDMACDNDDGEKEEHNQEGCDQIRPRHGDPAANAAAQQIVKVKQ